MNTGTPVEGVTTPVAPEGLRGDKGAAKNAPVKVEIIIPVDAYWVVEGLVEPLASKLIEKFGAKVVNDVFEALLEPFYENVDDIRTWVTLTHILQEGIEAARRVPGGQDVLAAIGNIAVVTDSCGIWGFVQDFERSTRNLLFEYFNDIETEKKFFSGITPAIKELIESSLSPPLTATTILISLSPLTVMALKAQLHRGFIVPLAPVEISVVEADVEHSIEDVFYDIFSVAWHQLRSP